MATLVPFAISVAIVLAVPGPTNALLSSCAGTIGARRALAMIAAQVAGYLVAIGLLRSASGFVLAGSPNIAIALQAAVALLLARIAWRLWRSDTSAQPATSVGARQVFLITLLNPKAVVLAFAVFPALDGPAAVSAHAAMFALTAVATASGWILFGLALRRGVLRQHAARVLPRCAAVVLGLFASGAAGSAIAAII